jgi:hypothetical protein
MEQNVVPARVGNASILVEVRGDAPVADPEQDVTMRVPSFSGVVDAIKAITGELTGMLDQLAPNKASIELGVDVGVESGQLTALLVKGSGNATLKITLEWEKKTG